MTVDLFSLAHANYVGDESTLIGPTSNIFINPINIVEASNFPSRTSKTQSEKAIS